MERRYVVLWNVDGPEAREAGLLVERDDHVLVDVSHRYCIPPRQRGHFTVGASDGTLVTYAPGDDGYFEQVLSALGSTFAIGEHSTFDDAEITVPELYARKVTNALIAKERRSYPAEHVAAPYQPSIAEAAPSAPGAPRRALLVA